MPRLVPTCRIEIRPAGRMPVFCMLYDTGRDMHVIRIRTAAGGTPRRQPGADMY
jgi:hypothetical protein